MQRAVQSSVSKIGKNVPERASCFDMLQKRFVHVSKNRSLISPNGRQSNRVPQHHQQACDISKHNSTIAIAPSAVNSKTRNATTKTKLTSDQIKAVLLSAAVPMVGFGFMDNLIMIQAGSYIDSTLGVQFGLTTLTAAALGQVVSDVSGVAFGNTLERWMSPWVKPASLTSVQRQLAIVPKLRLVGAVGGVMIGCLLGATSLVFVKDSEKDKSIYQQMQQLRGVLQDLLKQEDTNGALRNATYRIHMKDATASSQQLMSDGDKIAVVGIDQANDFVGLCLAQKETVTNQETIYVPVSMSDSNETVAVIEIKTNGSDAIAEEEDIKESTKRIARYIGIFMTHMIDEAD